ncbi:aminodeoxychorismate synthase component I [Verrucomicrobia bacterium]|nr:aminodeoxychorismate synthase component I [Verrucomicrobiota bacterium]
MRPVIEQLDNVPEPEDIVRALGERPGVQMLRSRMFQFESSRISLIVAEPFLTFRSYGSRCEISIDGELKTTFGNPWAVLDLLMGRFELPDEADCPFPLGGAFGYWGYDLKCFVESRAITRAVNDLQIPDCHVGFHDSLIVIDHKKNTGVIISTGQTATGDRCPEKAIEQATFWKGIVDKAMTIPMEIEPEKLNQHSNPPDYTSSLSRAEYIAAVEKANDYIHQGDIYQVNISRRITCNAPCSPWAFYQSISNLSPAPYGGWLDAGDFQIISNSPEQFLKMSGSHIRTRPIKGTRPRSSDPTRDAQLAYELQTSEKEQAELLMITDLLRNDLGRICEYGSIRVPELLKLEKFSHVHHQVSTVEGELRGDLSHFKAFAQCFPGGSITGAPKIRSMQVIDELESVSRGPYTGSMGYIGFNRESQLNIAIRITVAHNGQFHFHAGSGIVADSEAAAEFEETNHKAAAFFQAMERQTINSPKKV